MCWEVHVCYLSMNMYKWLSICKHPGRQNSVTWHVHLRQTCYCKRGGVVHCMTRSSSASLFDTRGTYSGVSPCLHRELLTTTKWHRFTILYKNSGNYSFLPSNMLHSTYILWQSLSLKLKQLHVLFCPEEVWQCKRSIHFSLEVHTEMKSHHIIDQGLQEPRVLH
jgi:hypothetical protein